MESGSGEHQRDVEDTARVGDERDVLAGFDGADLQDEPFGQPVDPVDVPHLLGSGRFRPRRGGERGDRRVAAAQRVETFGGEVRDRDEHVGPSHGIAQQCALTGGAVLAERPRGVEDGEIVERRDGDTGTQDGQVDVEAVEQVDPADGHLGVQHPPHPVGDRSYRRGHARGQFTHGIALHRRAQRSRGEQRVERGQQLADVGLDSTAGRTECEGAESDAVSELR